MEELTNKQQVFVNEYLRCWNASEAARVAGYSHPNVQGSRLLAKVSISEEIRRRVDALTMTSDEVMVELTKQARGDIGVFFKLVEGWTFYPLPTYEILDEKEVEIPGPDGEPSGETKICYLCRHVVVDMDKVIDPRYSHLLSEFRDSPKDGIVIKPYSKQSALQTLAKIRGAVVDKVEVSGPNGGPIPVRHDLSRLTDEELEALEQIKRKLG